MKIRILLAAMFTKSVGEANTNGGVLMDGDSYSNRDDEKKEIELISACIRVTLVLVFLIGNIDL